MHGDGYITLIVLLIFEGDGDTVGQVEGGVAMVELASVMEESDVLEGEELGAALGRAGDFAVFAGAHGEEEGANGQLADRLVEGGVLDGGELMKDMGSDGLLWYLAGVGVGVTFQLSL